MRHDVPIVQERHPREQGLKPQVGPLLSPLTFSSRATSTRTRIETRGSYCVQNPGCRSRATSTRTRIETVSLRRVPGAVVCSRATSTRTRIETNKYGIPIVPNDDVQERHPREQGLKQVWVVLVQALSLRVQERHPREQGLKHVF